MKEESCGNGGVVESVEIQKQDFPSSHRSLEISQNRRDSHIPTAPATRRVEKWKTKSRFPTFPPPCVGLNKRPKAADSVGEGKGTLLSK
jgi:hypothetical protein